MSITSFDSSTLRSLFQLNNTQSLFNRSLNQLSTGSRINRASDDPPGMIASTNLQAALELLEAESNNVQRASNIIDTADGGLEVISEQLTDARTLEVQLANSDALSDDEVAAIETELNSIYSSIDRTASNTTFLDSNLLDGSATIIASGESITLPDATADNLGVTEIDSETYNLTDLESGGSLDGDSESRLLILDNATHRLPPLAQRSARFRRTISIACKPPTTTQSATLPMRSRRSTIRTTAARHPISCDSASCKTHRWQRLVLCRRTTRR